MKACQTPVLVLPDDSAGAFICGRDRERDACTKRPTEHVPLERYPGEDTAGGAPRSQLPAVASASLGTNVAAPAVGGRGSNGTETTGAGRCDLGSHPLNLGVRFLLEVAALFSMGTLGLAAW